MSELDQGIDALLYRIAELERENARLRDRCRPSKVVMIGDTGHYVSEAVAAELEALRAQLAAERERADKAERSVSVLQSAARNIQSVFDEYKASRTAANLRLVTETTQAVERRVSAELDSQRAANARLTEMLEQAVAERDALKAELADLRGQADAICCALACTWDQAMGEARSLVIENDRLNDERDALKADAERWRRYTQLELASRINGREDWLYNLGMAETTAELNAAMDAEIRSAAKSGPVTVTKPAAGKESDARAQKGGDDAAE